LVRQAAMVMSANKQYALGEFMIFLVRWVNRSKRRCCALRALPLPLLDGTEKTEGDVDGDEDADDHADDVRDRLPPRRGKRSEEVSLRERLRRCARTGTPSRVSKISKKMLLR